MRDKDKVKDMTHKDFLLAWTIGFTGIIVGILGFFSFIFGEIGFGTWIRAMVLCEIIGIIVVGIRAIIFIIGGVEIEDESK